MAGENDMSAGGNGPQPGGMQGGNPGGGGPVAQKLAAAVQVRQAILQKGMMVMDKAAQKKSEGLQMTSQAQHFGGKGRLLNATFDVDPFEKQQLADKLPEMFGVDSSDRSVHSFLTDSRNIAKAHDTMSTVLGRSKANDIMTQVARSQPGKNVASQMGKVQKANMVKNFKRQGNVGDAAKFDYMTWMNGK